jgi:hypothetical protein
MSQLRHNRALFLYPVAQSMPDFQCDSRFAMERWDGKSRGFWLLRRFRMENPAGFGSYGASGREIPRVLAPTRRQDGKSHGFWLLRGVRTGNPTDFGSRGVSGREIPWVLAPADGKSVPPARGRDHATSEIRLILALSRCHPRGGRAVWIARRRGAGSHRMPAARGPRRCGRL